MKKNIIYIFLCLFLLSCEKTIDFKEKSVSPFMVLNSYINPEEVINVEITKSQSVINKFKEESILNAEVSVFENDILFEKLNYNKDTKSYKGTKNPVVGKTYSLKASASGFDNISSQTSIPEKTTISDNNFIFNNLKSQNEVVEANIKFKDDPNKKNFYRIIVEEEVYHEYPPENTNLEINNTGSLFYKDSEWDGNIQRRWFSIESKDPALTGKGQDNSDEYFDDIPDNIFNIFNDELFNGNEYSLEFSFNTYYYEDLPQKVTVYLMTISEDYYLFLRTYAAQIYFADSPFSEPVQIYSNIKNGAGVMGAYNYEKILVYDRINRNE